MPHTHPRERTLIVLGAPRGGTTMIAGCLHHLGVPMGDTAGPTVFEDQRLGKSLDSGEEEEFDRVIAEMNRKYPVWGWKRPTSYRRLDDLVGRFRSPYFIAVFRDPLSVGIRERISMRFDPAKIMSQTLDAYGAITRFMQTTDRPFLGVSFEKALRYPRYFVAELISFTGIEAAPEPAISFIDPEPESYLMRSHRRKDL